jgi:hypothetical protein
MKAPRLEGPKIIGRIELPVSQPSGNRPDNREKRKRKRIPVDKKSEPGKPDTNNRDRNTPAPGAGGQQPKCLSWPWENLAAEPFYPGSGAKPSHIQGIQFAGWRCGIQAGYYGDLSRHLPLTRDLDRKNHIKALPKGLEDPG